MRQIARAILLVMAAVLGPAQAVPAASIIPTAIVEADLDSVNELMAAFQRAERAAETGDLDTIMEFYSDQYDFHRFGKAMIRNIWKDLFKDFRQIRSSHTFSSIRVMGPASDRSAEIICTGAIWATSDLTKLRVPIDSWFEEVHFLVREGNTWRIRGNAGDTPGVLPFGTAPHPLF